MTTRMFVEPTLMVDRERLTKYRDNEITNSEQLIEASGIDRKVLSSNQQFTEYLKTTHNINAPPKNHQLQANRYQLSARTTQATNSYATNIPSCSISGTLVSLSNHVLQRRARSASWMHVTKTERSACPSDIMQHTPVALVAQKKSTCKTYLGAARYVSRLSRRRGISVCS